ncbi:helix-turn-helix domain-containing protein [Staphylococcus roterodami]|nr:helix-turn-helix domain-containing protein [Staphylococcus roterodami]
MEFGETLNEVRQSLNISINKLGALSDISPTYISRIQNNPDKHPSKKIVFKIIYALFVEGHKQSFNTNEIATKLIRSYLGGNAKTSELEGFLDEFIQYMEDRQNEGKEKLYNFKEKIQKNRFILTKNRTLYFTDDQKSIFDIISNKPLTDIEWLLTQNSFELLYSRSIITNNSYKDIDYNILNDADKKVILNIIHAYLSTKYEKTSNIDSNFFNSMFKNFIESYNSTELIINGNKNDKDNNSEN